MPAALPVVLWFQRLLGLRKHECPPSWPEMFFHLAVWSVMCKIIGPFYFHIGVADPWDILFFAAGGMCGLSLVEPLGGAILPHFVMNFDRLATHYHWLENLFAGGLMQRCRTTFLSCTKNSRNALLVGEGTGRFLVELLHFNPQIQITCVEQSDGMIEQARQRLARERLDCSRVKFEQTDVLRWKPPADKFDLVVTNFFLDCFRADELQKLVSLLAKSATAEAVWLLADFRVPERGWRRTRANIGLWALYAFFKVIHLFVRKLANTARCFFDCRWLQAG